MAVTLSVSNRKGGTGKTTVAVNIAAELAALGKRVLLIDLDSQGHCAVGLGMKVKKQDLSSHDIFRQPGVRLADALLQSPLHNLSLVPADPMFEHGSGLRGENLLACALGKDEITSSFDVVILDTPPSLDMLLLNALTASNFVLVPYVPHPLSLEGVRQLMRVLFRIMSGPNKTLKIAGFLPMMVANHILQHRTVSKDMAQAFGALRVFPGIRNDIRLAESFAAGKPIRYYAPKSRSAEDFVHFVSTVLPKLCPV